MFKLLFIFLATSLVNTPSFRESNDGTSCTFTYHVYCPDGTYAGRAEGYGANCAQARERAKAVVSGVDWCS